MRTVASEEAASPSTDKTPVLRTLHVGVGGRGRWSIEVAAADPAFQPVAAVDLSEQALAWASQTAGLPDGSTFASLTEALASVEADAAIICTPTTTHAPLAREAFAAGLHVLVEKGMTTHWEEAKQLVADADAAGVRFAVAQNYRYTPLERRVKQAIDDPQDPLHPGRIEIADYVQHRYRPQPHTLNYPFAMIWDMSCHHMDSLINWLGPIQRVQAVASNPSWSSYEHDADIHATLEFASGAVCNYVLTHAAVMTDTRVMLQGARGHLRLFDEPGLQFVPRPARVQNFAPAEQLTRIFPDGPRSEQPLAEDFYRYCVTGEEPGICGRCNLNTLSACEMLVRSATDRRPVTRDELFADGSAAGPIA